MLRWIAHTDWTDAIGRAHLGDDQSQAYASHALTAIKRVLPGLGYRLTSRRRTRRTR